MGFAICANIVSTPAVQVFEVLFPERLHVSHVIVEDYNRPKLKTTCFAFHCQLQEEKQRVLTVTGAFLFLALQRALSDII